MIIKSLLTAAAIAVVPSAAISSELVVDPNLTINRGEATNIRNCPFNGEYDRAVCYNQVREGSVSVFGVPVLPVTWSTDRAYTVDCLRRAPYSNKTVAGRVANEFCPVVSELPVAPFLR